MHYISLRPFSRSIRFEKEEGQVMPRGYAVSYRDIRMQTTICYPLGIHFLVRWSRDSLFWLMRAGYPGYRQRIEHELYWDGVNEGIRRSR